MERRRFLIAGGACATAGAVMRPVAAQVPPAPPVPFSAPPSIAPTKPMNTKPVLSLENARKVAAAAEAEALANHWLVSIAICDDGGHLLCLSRLDGAPPATAPIAMEKARTAALIRRPTKAFEDAINNGRVALMSTTAISAILEGGEPLMVDSHCVGSIGISGQRPHEDMQVLKKGLAALPSR